MTFQAIVHASELLTGAGVRAKGGRRVSDADMGRIVDGAIVYSVKKVGGKSVPHRIEWVGETSKLPKRFARAKKTDLKGKRALVPGFVDCHTHLVFAGDRSEEFAARCGGATYEQIAAKGGGILTTVRATREASVAELERLAIPRVKEMSAYGVRTIEIKSGYGLEHECELKCLEVVARLAKRFPELTLVPTFLGAHAVPKDRSRTEYLTELLEKTLPEVSRRKLAHACDVFVDEGYYTRDEAREILKKARALRLETKIHADELGNTESASLAAELGALSADHLLRVSDDGVKKLAASGTVAVLLPGTAFYLKAPHAPARKLLDSGAIVALSTDFNPGTSMCLSLPAVMTIAALYLGMSRSEIFSAVTFNAAKALGLESRKGTLEAGMDADFAILPFGRFEETYYRFAWAPA
ncbi:MAG TPA: imidazolonepropionase [Bdellovibrionota bacterium]|nr:imidazolonepropionase [Bdellovibrionota bacterium]